MDMIQKLPKLRHLADRCCQRHIIDLEVRTAFHPPGYGGHTGESGDEKALSRAYAQHVLDVTEAVRKVLVGEFCWCWSETGAQEMDREKVQEVDLFTMFPLGALTFD
jgi:hypothetical protein